MFRVPGGSNVDSEEEKRKARENTMQNLAGFAIAVAIINLGEISFYLRHISL